MDSDKDSGMIKIFPALGLAAITARLGSAWRLWTIARAIDVDGDGKLLKKELRAFLSDQGISDRNIRRWMELSLQFGFLRSYEGKLYLSGLESVSDILDVYRINRPVLVRKNHLLHKGWHSIIWSAYLVTLREKPVSQEMKYQLTGISPRVQRNYQFAQPGNKRGNFAKTNILPSHLRGVQDNFEGHYYKVGNIVIQRLPDIRLVPSFLAVLAKPGRVRKYQKAINSRHYVGRDPLSPNRLFHHAASDIVRSNRNLRKTELLLWHLPTEIFQLQYAGRLNNMWKTIPTGIYLL